MNKLKAWLLIILASFLSEFAMLRASRSCDSRCSADRDNCNTGFDNCNIGSRDGRSCDNTCDGRRSCDNACSGRKSCDRRRSCDSICGARSVFVPRSLTTDQTLELALNNYHTYRPYGPISYGPNVCTPCLPGFFFQASYFHMESRKARCLGRYFLPNNKDSVVIAENGTGDVGSLWLELISAPGTRFLSKVSLAPKRKVDGGYFRFFFDASQWGCGGAWASISFAVARVEHRLNICEENSGNLGTLPGLATAVQALNNPAWTAGRFSRRTLCRTRVDDVQFKLGYNYFLCNRDHIGAYFVATAPTGCRNRGLYVFEPRIGSRHGSVGVGISSDMTVWNACNQAVTWMLDAKYRYVLSSCERRSFDLKCRGDWSRYMQVVTPDERSLSRPGINFFTRRAKVTPGSTVDLWTALHYACNCYHLELGYNFWWRDCEKVCLRSKLCNIGIYDLSGDCRGNPTSANSANITETVVGAGTNVAPSDPAFISLTNRDLNLTSGTAPRAFTNKIYAAASYNSIVWCSPFMIGVGGSYEFAHRNSALEQWAVWLKTGIAF